MGVYSEVKSSNHHKTIGTLLHFKALFFSPLLNTIFFFLQASFCIFLIVDVLGRIPSSSLVRFQNADRLYGER